jgi:hypothetical protein
MGAVCVAGAAKAGVDFETQVLPILQAKCFKCHGHGEAKGKLSLEAGDMARNIGPGRVIRPGDPEKSKFITLLLDDGEDRMPAKGGPLKQSSIETLTTWVKEGASLLKGGAIVAAENGKKPLAGTWTNVDGVQIEADLLQVEAGKVVLRLKSGKLYRYPLEQLSVESREKIAEWEKE